MRVRPGRALSPPRATKYNTRLQRPQGAPLLLATSVAAKDAVHVVRLLSGVRLTSAVSGFPFAVTDTCTGRSVNQGEGFTLRPHPFAVVRSSLLCAAACGVALVPFTHPRAGLLSQQRAPRVQHDKGETPERSRKAYPVT